MSKASSVPTGECRQCWTHAYDKSIHAGLAPREDCPACVDHMINGHPDHMLVQGGLS